MSEAPVGFAEAVEYLRNGIVKASGMPIAPRHPLTISSPRNPPFPSRPAPAPRWSTASHGIHHPASRPASRHQCPGQWDYPYTLCPPPFPPLNPCAVTNFCRPLKIGARLSPNLGSDPAEKQKIEESIGAIASHGEDSGLDHDELLELSSLITRSRLSKQGLTTQQCCPPLRTRCCPALRPWTLASTDAVSTRLGVTGAPRSTCPHRKTEILPLPSISRCPTTRRRVPSQAGQDPGAPDDSTSPGPAQHHRAL